MQEGESRDWIAISTGARVALTNGVYHFGDWSKSTRLWIWASEQYIPANEQWEAASEVEIYELDRIFAGYRYVLNVVDRG